MVWRFRPDGDLVKGVPHTRKIMPFIMRTRNEAAVYFEQDVVVTKTLPWLQEARERTGRHLTLLHLLLWSVAQTLEQRPRLNRFTAGGRIWQRRGIWISFSAKKGKTDDDPIVLIKRRIDPKWSLLELVDRIDGDVKVGRSDKKSGTDKELALLFLLPVFLLHIVTRVLMKADHWGLLPRFFVDGDPMFGSVFVANLGSIGMEAAFHHMYEYGNIPIFIVTGRAKDDVMKIRYTLDERVEDGLYCARALELLKERLEDPAQFIELDATVEQPADVDATIDAPAA